MSEHVTPPRAVPSATVIVLRDVGSRMEALLLRRNSKIAFHGGAWVFPGGHIDLEDQSLDAPNDMLATARQAAVLRSSPRQPRREHGRSRSAAGSQARAAGAGGALHEVSGGMRSFAHEGLRPRVVASSNLRVVGDETDCRSAEVPHS